MPREFSRRLRVGEQLRRELAPLLQALAGEQGLGLVSITAVDVSPDLRRARVGLSHVEGAAAGYVACECCARAAGEWRQLIGRRLRLRRIPRLDFVVDHSLERAARLEAALAGTTGSGESTP